MNDQPRTDLQRMGDWLAGDITISRKILVAGAVLLAVLAIIALD